MKLKWFDARDFKKKKKMGEFTFFTNGKIEQGFVLINQYGAIRFKKEFAVAMGFVAGSRWLIGTKDGEAPAKYLYVLKPDSENEQNGFKMMYQNKSWFITCKTLLTVLDVQFPVKCKFEPYKDEKHEGFRIILPNK